VPNEFGPYFVTNVSTVYLLTYMHLCSCCSVLYCERL